MKLTRNIELKFEKRERLVVHRRHLIPVPRCPRCNAEVATSGQKVETDATETTTHEMPAARTDEEYS
jgi:hypothetical protein